MNNRFKILMLLALACISVICSSEAFAQTYHYHSYTMPQCATGTVTDATTLVGNGDDKGSYLHSVNSTTGSTWRLQRITVSTLDENMDVDRVIAVQTSAMTTASGASADWVEAGNPMWSLTNPQASNVIGPTGASFVQYILSNGSTTTYRLGYGVFRVKDLIVWLNNTPVWEEDTDGDGELELVSCAGKTIRVTAEYGSSLGAISNKFDYDFDLVSAPVITGAVGVEYDEGNAVYSAAVCEGDDIEFSIGNGQYPYGESPTGLGYVYEAVYSWDLLNENLGDPAGLTQDYASGSSVSLSGVTSGPSNVYKFTPYVTFTAHEGTKTGPVVGESCRTQMGAIRIQYDAPVTTFLDINGESTYAQSVCEGDDVELEPTFKKVDDDDFLYDGFAELYIKKGGSYELVETFDLFDAGYTIYAEDIPIVGNANTTYEYKYVVYDQTYNWAESECVYEQPFTITVKEKRAKITFPSEVASVCEDGSVSLTATVTGANSATYTCTWSGVDCTPSFDSYVTSASALSVVDEGASFNSGSRTYRLTVSNDGCDIYDDVIVTMYERPVLTAVEPVVEVCKGKTIDLKVTSTQENVNITWTPADGVAKNGGLIYTVTGDYDGKVYKVTAVNTITGCDTKVPAEITVKVNQLPVIDYVSGAETPLCEDATATLKPTSISGSTAAPYTFYWSWKENGASKNATSKSDDANGGALMFKPSIDIPAAGAAFDFTVYAVDSKECDKGNEYNFTVTYKPKPEFTITPNDGCSNGDATLVMEPKSGYSGLTYVVTPLSGAVSGTFSGNVYTVNQTVSSKQVYKYSVVASVAGCDSDPVEESVAVFPLPEVVLKADKAEYCLGETVKLTATATGVTYSWEGLSGSASSNSDVPTVAGTKTYKVMVQSTTAPYCENEATVTVVINPLPSVTLTATPETICEGQSSVLTASAAGGSGVYTYTWTGVSSSTNTATVSPIVDTEYKVSVTDNKKCAATSDASVTVKVNKKPTFTATPDREVCYGSTGDVVINVAITSGNASYVTLAGGERKAVVDNKVDFTVNRTWTENPTTFLFTAESGSCDFNAESDKVKAKVVVNTKPDAPVVATPADVCDGDPVTMTVSSPNSSYTYKWYSDAACTDQLSVGTSYKVASLAAGSTVYYVKSFLGDCESDITSVTATAVAYPAKPVIETSSASMCSNDSKLGVTLLVSSPDPSLTYYWFKSDGTPVTMPVTPSETTSYYVVAENATGCQSEKSDMITMTIFTSPTIELGLVDMSYCQFDEVALDVTATGSNLEYHWSVDEVENLANDNIVYKASTSGPISITVYVEDTETLCKSETVSFDFNVNAAPTYTITPSERDVCEGESIELTLTTDASDPDIFIGKRLKGDTTSPVDYSDDAKGHGYWGYLSPVTKTITPLSGYDYFVKIIDWNACTLEDSPFELSVFTAPETTVDGNTTVCVDNELNITIVPSDAATYTYSWKKDGTVWSTSDNLYAANVTEAYNGTFEVVIENVKHCQATVNVDVTVNKYALTSIIGDDFICEGSTLSLKAKDNDMVSYSWSAEVDGSVVATSTDDTFNYDASALAAGKHIDVTLDYSDKFCVGLQQKLTVVVRERPVIANVDNLTYCLSKGGSMNLTATLGNSIAGSTYKYYWSFNGGAEVEASEVYTPNVSLDNEGEWTVYAVEYVGDKLMCSGDPYTFNVDVRDFTIENVVANETEFCIGNTDVDPFVVDFEIQSDDASGMFTYDFTLTDNNDVVKDQVLGATDKKYIISSISSYDAGVYTLTIEAKYNDMSACSKSKTTSFTIYALPSNDITVTSHTETSADKFEPCDGDALTFEVSSATTYKVFVDGAEVADLSSVGLTQSGNKFTYLSKYPEVHTIYVEVGDAHCTNETKTITIAYQAPISVEQTVGGTTTELVGDLVQICEGDQVKLDFSMDGNTGDVALLLDGADAGVNSITVDSQVLGGAESKSQVVSATIGGCTRVVIVKTVQAPHTNIDLSADELCSDNEMTITITGAQTYEITVTRDGELMPADEFKDAVITKTYSYVDNSGSFSGTRADYNEYVISVVGHVGTCQDDAAVVKSFKVFKNPQVTLTPSATLVITGNVVTYTATAGYETYEFFVNDVSVATQTGTDNNIFKYSMTEDAEVKVIATTYYNCTDEDVVTIKTLEGIASLPVVFDYPGYDYYCSNQDGVTIKVEGPQEGITYRLNECASCSPITYDGTNTVAWYKVKVLEGETTSTYSVSAYHESLPGEVFDMANTLDVTEVPAPTSFKLLPYNESYDRCDVGFMISLEGSETNMFYTLFRNDDPMPGFEYVPGNGGQLDFLVAKSGGVYTAKAYSSYNGGYVCETKMDGTYSITTPEAEIFDVLKYPTDGLYCETSDGVEIKLSGTENGYEYVLFKDNIQYFDGEGHERRIIGGETNTFGKLTDEGNYTVWCFYNGCEQLMNGSVDVKMVTQPADQTLTVTNYGHFCEGSEGVTITLGGQEEGYYYALYCDGNLVADHVGVSGNPSYDFENITTVGNYTMVVEIPGVEAGCTRTLTDAVDVYEDKLPKEITMKLLANTICRDDFTDVQINGTEENVEYRLLENGNYLTSLYDTEGTARLIFKNVNGGGVKGSYTYTIEAIKTIVVEDGINTNTCPMTMAASEILRVENRPLDDGENEIVREATDSELADKRAADPCYGTDIIVENAQTSTELTFTYKLYRKNADDTWSYKSSFESTGNINNDRFNDIQDNNGIYRVGVYNGFCEDPIASQEVHITSDKFVTVQEVSVIDHMCQGDLGNDVRLLAAEDGVVYRLYDENDNILDEHIASGTASFKFSYKVINPGHYYVTGSKIGGCEIRMIPEFDFTVHPLPISYKLSGDDVYCDDLGVQLKLDGSELDVEYALYEKKGEDLFLVDTKYGTGDEFYFKTLPAGTYIAAARDEYTECTSSMLGEVVVKQMAPITALEDDEMSGSKIVCSDLVLSYTTNLTNNATYYLVNVGSDLVDAIDSVKYNGVDPVEFTLTETGDYNVIAAYSTKHLCKVVYDKINYVRTSIDESVVITLDETEVCNGSVKVVIETPQDGVTYVLNSDAITYSSKFSTGAPIEWTVSEMGTNAYYIVASVEGCGNVTLPSFEVTINEKFTHLNDDAVIDNLCQADYVSIDKFLNEGQSLIEGATYYLAKQGQDVTLTGGVRYVGATIPQFFVSESGHYQFYASYDGFKCLTPISKEYLFTVTPLTKFPVVAKPSCDGNVTVTLQGTEPGVIYTINDVEGVADEDGNLTWVFAASTVGNETYTVIGSKEGCSGVEIGVVSAATIPNLNPSGEVIVKDVNACPGYQIEWDGVAFINDAIYYLVKGKNDPSTGSEVFSKYTGEKPEFMLTSSGVYTVWATFNSECFTQLMTINFTSIPYAGTATLSANTLCGDNVVVLTNCESGVTYRFNDIDMTPNESGVVQWTLESIPTTPTPIYAIVGECDPFVIFTVSGDSFVGSSLKDIVSVSSNPNCVYTEILVSNAIPGFIYSDRNHPQYSEEGSGNDISWKIRGTGSYTYDVWAVNINNPECEFQLGSSVLDLTALRTDTTLFAVGTNEYCGYDFGVELALSNGYKNTTYRLYKVKEEDELFDELMDIQELPYYYTKEKVDTLMFNGWAFNSADYRHKAAAGTYYVVVDDSDSNCRFSTDSVTVVENPLPYSAVNDTVSMYFAAGEFINGHYNVSADTKNDKFGLVDTGFLVLENAHKGYKYELVHLNVVNGVDYVLHTIDDVEEGDTIFMGPITSELKELITYESDGVMLTDTVNVMGIGDYTIRITDMTHETMCQTELEGVTMIDEELTTYDVFLFMNGSQSAIRQKLIPSYGHKGNHKFLDWSATIDKVYTPEVTTSPDGTSTVTSDMNVDKFGDQTGYSSLRGDLCTNANIVFELLDQSSVTYLDAYEPGCLTDSVVTTEFLDKYEVGCDSTYTTTSYQYVKYIFDEHGNAQGTLKLDEWQEGCDSIAIGGYSYWKKNTIYTYYKIESLKDKMFGSCGFDDYDGTSELLWESMTGEFVYRRAANFYGKEVIPYRAYNARMRNIRYSNISHITILCGNENVPGDSTTFLIPNVISPNGDGKNDKFYVMLPEAYENNHTSSLEVFNRWGTLVYRSSGVKYGEWKDGSSESQRRENGCPEWDGTSKTSNMLTVGEKLPQGTYFYIFTINFNIDNEIRTKKLSGYVELRK
ncbi:MAG: gliding motility-associated C-terminal domain-containing protein [Bacteroidales bacterium]|nr:gliding motility-associated C-terminal domain-containing protein [Bacteroidales bacterium]